MRNTIVVGLLLLVAGLSSASSEEHAVATPTEASLGVLGFTVGMTVEDSLALIAATFPGVEPQIGVRAHRQTQKEYTNYVAVYAQNNGVNEELRLYFTGYYSGNRLYSAYRSVTYPLDHQASGAATKAAILEKFGLPTMSSGNTSFSFAYNPEKIMLGSDDEVRAIVDDGGFDYLELVRGSSDGIETYGNASSCMEAINKVQNAQFFNAAEADGDVPGCMAALSVGMAVDGDLLRTMSMTFADFRFVLDSAAADRAADTEQADDVVPTGETPKL